MRAQQGTKIRKPRRRLIGLSILLVVFLATGTLSPIYGWNNGGTNRTAWQKKNAVAKPDFTSAAAFTVNILPIKKDSRGIGIGTHDLMLEQGIANAIYGGADVSWINVNVARNATAEPDHSGSARQRFLYGGDYRGFRGGGTAPKDIGIIYREIVVALNAGDKTTASRKLGWMAHYLSDITQPFHVATYTQRKPIPGSRWHMMHVSFESDLDYYIKYTVGNPLKRWPDATDEAIFYVPGLDEVDDDSTSQQIRLIWFGGKYRKPPVLKKSARQIAIDTSKKVRNNYTTKALKVWATTWKKKYQTVPRPLKSRGKGTTWLLKNAPGMLAPGATSLASLITALSDPATRNAGIDKIKKPTISLKTVKQSAKDAKNFGQYTATFTVKGANKKALYEFQLLVSWRDMNKNTILRKSQLVWTDKSGKASSYITVTRRSKDYRLKVSITAPTSNFRGTVSKKVTVRK
jgi:hypothetical protein